MDVPDPGTFNETESSEKRPRETLLWSPFLSLFTRDHGNRSRLGDTSDVLFRGFIQRDSLNRLYRVV